MAGKTKKAAAAASSSAKEAGATMKQQQPHRLREEAAVSRKRRKLDEAEEEPAMEEEESDEEGEQEAAATNGLREFRERMLGKGKGVGDGGSSSSDSDGGSDDEEDEDGAGGNAKRMLLGRQQQQQQKQGKKRAAAASASEESAGPEATLPPVKYDGSYRNKQRVLVFCSRGVTARYRHLLEDLRKLIPHHKKDVKLDCKGDLQVINEIAEVKSCNNCVFLEARKRQDLYLWVSKTPLGPSVKFNVLNVHTMDELRLTGNAMLGSRPLLSFDAAFEESPHTQLIKALLTDAFGTPRGHPKSKPFVDRVLAFALADGKVWVRNYQIVDQAAAPALAKGQQGKAVAEAAAKEEAKAARRGEELTSLVEIGPRFVLNPIRIFAGSFGGPTLYQNPQFLSPNFVRAERKRAEGQRRAAKMQADGARKERRAATVIPKDELAGHELFRKQLPEESGEEESE